MYKAEYYVDPVIVERMPEHLRASHIAAGNWGSYPSNGAERVIMERVDTALWSFNEDEAKFYNIDADAYDHIVRDATHADFALYEAE